MQTDAYGEGQSGVSASRLKLPGGPGSIEGVGENAEPNINMGLMTYGVPIAVPQGHEGISPILRLEYSSGAGASTVGIGWSLAMPSIERMTARGLPRYDATDEFTASESGELVRVDNSGTYRARYEGNFIRYTWLDGTTAGTGGYWKAEHPDGRISYYGADAAGAVDENAMVRGPQGVFRFHLVETVDVHGHRLRYEYTKNGATSLVRRIGWVYAGSTPRYEAVFDYEDRPDNLSDAKPGFEVRLSKRLVSITIRARGEQLRKYELRYEGGAGLTRLNRVVQFGRAGSDPYPVEFDFTYTDYLQGQCNRAVCEQPFVHSMGSLGVDFGTANADLIDINGDGLPDVIDTTGGNHVLHANALSANSAHSFASAASSTVATGGATQLSSPLVQMVDLDGDGFTDMVDGANREVFWNDGSGDWSGRQSFTDVHLPDFANDANLRFFDYDNDKKIDVIHADATSTWFYRNRGDGTFDPVPVSGEPIGASLSDGLQFADLNGDGMQDAVRRVPGLISYRMYLGYGRWSGWIDMDGVPSNLSPDANFVDINGDGLSDIIVVSGNEVHFALNRNGSSFGQMVAVNSVAGGSIPERTSSVSVRFADMNASGSTDVVWVDASGQLTYLEMFPTRPNLMKRITNSLGKNIDVTYGSSADHMARDGGTDAWSARLPHSMLVVDSIDTWDTLSGIHQVQTFRYHEGYYDGEEKQFRGFKRVEVLSQGDDSVEDGRNIHFFDVGQDDRYRKGRLLKKVMLSGDRVINQVDHEYADCVVTGAPDNLTPAVRYVCKTAIETILREGAPEEEWARVRQEFEYDGYGNQTKVARLGLVSVGEGGCEPCSRDPEVTGAPCGAQCVGDEAYTETSFVSPHNTGGRWMLRKTARERTYGRLGSEVVAEKVTFYDGRPLVGLTEGALTLGLVSRVSEKVQAGVWIDTARNRHDVHGNVVEFVDANGHSRRFEYDDYGVLPTAEVVVFDERDVPYELRMELVYDPVLDQPTASTAWMLDESGQIQTARNETTYAYDDFARLVAIARPGDTLALPTEEFQYDLGDPVSRIVRFGRTGEASEYDVAEIKCFDGMGRRFQTRTRIEEGRYQVNGFTRFNIHGKERETFQAYTSTSDRCDHIPAEGVPFVETDYDGSGRPVASTLPDGGIYGSASRTRTVYGPLSTAFYDPEDTDSTSPHYDTPTIEAVDGLGRTTKFTRYLQDAPEPIELHITYDELNNLRGFVDTQGNEKRQVYDLLGRVVSVFDPDAGLTGFEYDWAGNQVARVGPRGFTTRYTYDEANRVLAEWEATDEDSTRVSYIYDRRDDCSSLPCLNTAGKLVQISYPLDSEVGGDWLGYDSRGRQDYFARRIDNYTFEFGTEYDNLGRVTAKIYPGRRRVNYRLDGAGRVSSVPGYFPGIRYNQHGDIAGIERANGVKTSFTHDALSRLARIRAFSDGQPGLQDYHYQRDRAGNITYLTDRSGFGPEEPTASADYLYDSLYRLIEARLDGDTGFEEVVNYTYDSIDNIVAKTSSLNSKSPAHMGQYKYGIGAGPRAVTQTGDQHFKYDAAGNLVDDASKRLKWDFKSRLVKATDAQGNSVSFTYGPDRARIKRQTRDGLVYYPTEDYEVRDGISSVYITVNGRRLAKLERDDISTNLLPDVAPLSENDQKLVSQPDGEVNAADAWVVHASEARILDVEGLDPEPRAVGAILSASAKRLVSSDGADGTEERVTYFHHDHLGSRVLSTDEAGDPNQRSSYYPYGARRHTTGNWDTTCGYAGKEYDSATALTYFGKRYLNARLGRWIQPDPAFSILRAENVDRFASGRAFYFNRNNPINFVDPTGTVEMMAAHGGPPERVVKTTQTIAKTYSSGLQAEVKVTGVPLGLGYKSDTEAYTETTVAYDLNSDRTTTDQKSGIRQKTTLSAGLASVTYTVESRANGTVSQKLTLELPWSKVDITKERGEYNVDFAGTAETSIGATVGTVSGKLSASFEANSEGLSLSAKGSVSAGDTGVSAELTGESTY